MMKYGLPEDIEVVSQEKLSDVVKEYALKVQAKFAKYEGMVKYLKDNSSKFSDLDPERNVRTVTPKDISLVIDAMDELSSAMKNLKTGEPVDLAELCNNGALNKIGVEYKHDGNIYIDKFLNGNWGAGASMRDVKRPVTFKKSVADHGWISVASTVVRNFSGVLSTTDKSSVLASIHQYFKDVSSATSSRLEKTESKTNNKVAYNQMKKMLSVFNKLAIFTFDQLTRVMRASKSNDSKTLIDTNTSSEYNNDQSF